VFSHIDEAPVLDALLRKTHWLKDHQLQLCMHQVTPRRVVGRRRAGPRHRAPPPEDAAAVGEWLAVSGIHDVMQDERLERSAPLPSPTLRRRLRLLRIAMRRARGASVQLLQAS
jgi:hypothetical protein